MTYQDIFQCLKGVGPLDLSDFALPVADTGYVLSPISCREGYIDENILTMLTNARNDNIGSFLTCFAATADRTCNWLINVVGKDEARILFSLRGLVSGELYGYMGFGYGDIEGNRIEGDAIVRYQKKVVPGLMRHAFLRLITWITNSLGVDEVWLRVLSDNPAVTFYQKCGFGIVRVAPLYEIRDKCGQLTELSESTSDKNFILSERTLVYMKYSLPV